MANPFFGWHYKRTKHPPKWLNWVDAKREILLSSLIILVIGIIGSVGYHYLEGWSWLDSIFMTFITLTTIGFGETHPLTPIGRIWTMIIAFFGISAGVYLFGKTAEFLFRRTSIYERTMKRSIELLDQHIIICGYGRIGERIAKELALHDADFVIIEHDPARASYLRNVNFLHLIGDAEQEETLELAGIQRASKIVLALENDRDNAFVSLLAKELNPNIYVLARTSFASPHNLSLLKRAGADKVISPYEIGATRMAQLLVRPHVHDFLERIENIGDLDVRLDEIVIRESSSFAHKSIKDNLFRQAFGVIVIAIHGVEAARVAADPHPSGNPWRSWR